jgi:hypothetical protein
LKGVSGRSEFKRADLLLRMLSRLVTEAAFRPNAAPIRTRSLPVAASSSSRLSSSEVHRFVLFLGICAGQKRSQCSTFKRRVALSFRTLPTSFGSCKGNGFSDRSFHEERARDARLLAISRSRGRAFTHRLPPASVGAWFGPARGITARNSDGFPSACAAPVSP